MAKAQVRLRPAGIFVKGFKATGIKDAEKMFSMGFKPFAGYVDALEKYTQCGPGSYIRVPLWHRTCLHFSTLQIHFHRSTGQHWYYWTDRRAANGKNRQATA